jgi:hypothetical protein
MALWHIPGQGIVNDAEGNIPEPGSLTLPDGSEITWGIEGTQRLPEYSNRWQYSREQPTFQWSPEYARPPQGVDSNFDYGPRLLSLAAQARAGTLTGDARAEYDKMRQAALAVPTRDSSTLRGDYRFFRDEDEDWAQQLSPTSPDLGAILLTIDDKMAAGTATPQERELYSTYTQHAASQAFDANKPDPFNPLGDQFFGALGVLGLGATGGLAAAPLFAGGAGLATTLGSVGTLAGIAGTGASVLGQALDQPWLRNVGLGLGIAGGLAGGIGGLTNVVGSGINSVADAARLAQSAGRVTGALGRIPGASPLQQASRYLGLAGQLGQGVSGVQGLLGAAQGVTQGAGQVAQTAQDLVTQRGGNMSEWDWLNLDLGSGEGYGTVLDPGMYAGGSPTFDESGGGFQQAYNNFLGWGGDERQTGWYQNADLDTSGGGGGAGWLNTILGGLGSVGGFLGRNAGVLGPAVSGLAGLGAGALGSNAANDAARLQASALNRGLDLQTAQWLQQQANQAPWLQAGQEALGHMRERSTWEQPTLQQTGPINSWDYPMPGATPGWSPQSYAGYTPTDVPSAAGYRYTPGQGPQAANYRYTPGQIPGAADYRYTPGAVPTLSGQELLANDPGVAFRLQEGRNALEASAAARGGALSGPALAALQRQGQELSSQEYGNAWQRASQQAQMREGWAQQASQMGFGQAMSEAQLREQVNQIASQQGWSQAQAEAAFREQLAQQAGAQNWGQALQEAQARAQQQQFGWQSGFQAQQAGQQEQQNWWNQLYGNQMQQNQMQYGRDWQQREAENQRMMEAYNAQRLNQTTAWNQFAGLAGTGQTAANQLGTTGAYTMENMGAMFNRLGSAQGQGALSSGNSWLNALQNMGQSAQGAFGNMAFQNQLTSLLAGLNR